MSDPALDAVAIDDLARAGSVADVQRVMRAVAKEPAAAQRLARELWSREDLYTTQFGALLPGIAAIRGESLPSRCSPRALNLLMRDGLMTWAQFAVSTPATLRRIKGCGARTFSEICGVAIMAWSALDPSDATDLQSATAVQPLQSG